MSVHSLRCSTYAAQRQRPSYRASMEPIWHLPLLLLHLDTIACTLQATGRVAVVLTYELRYAGCRSHFFPSPLTLVHRKSRIFLYVHFIEHWHWGKVIYAINILLVVGEFNIGGAHALVKMVLKLLKDMYY